MIEASRGPGAQTCDDKRDRLWVRLQLEEMKYLIFSLFNIYIILLALVKRQSSVLSFAIQHALPLEDLSSRFPLPTLVDVGVMHEYLPTFCFLENDSIDVYDNDNIEQEQETIEISFESEEKNENTIIEKETTKISNKSK